MNQHTDRPGDRYMQTGWHMDDDMTAMYAEGLLSPTTAASVEAHLLACARCRELLKPRVAQPRLDRIWDEIVDVVDAPAPGPFERLLRLAGVRHHVARLLAAAQSLRLPWLAGTSLTLFFAALAAGETTRWGGIVFLALAPIVPALGVSLAYGRGADPTYEIGLAAPYSAFKVMLLRAAAVLITSVVPALVIGVALLGQTWTVVGWLLPALALTSLSLLLSRWFEPVHAAGGVSALWLAGVLWTNLHAPSLAMFGGAEQLAYLIITVVSGGLLFLGREEFS
ncbi:zf-HC2 domain-containing protein [Microbispora sp. H11081]|uniref:zf-HC2 domain-containing protein n=1 Tax=Microbispora sp. H11081 TaxID=2729107 RepID=UPI00147532F2|nr:zf-HC2 domain-containing protein [Microbispora sp. H11081]